MNNIVFIIGMRRSGTSILRTLIEQHDMVSKVLFEPHDLMFAHSVKGIKRYHNDNKVLDIIDSFNNSTQIADPKYFGAKIALNVGIEAMHWKHLENYFQPKFIFISRNIDDVYKSYFKLDKNIIRGAVDYETYKPFFKHIQKSFMEFEKKNPKRSCIVNYENLIHDADKEMTKVWKVLGISGINGLGRFIKKPNNYREGE